MDTRRGMIAQLPHSTNLKTQMKVPSGWALDLSSWDTADVQGMSAG